MNVIAREPPNMTRADGYLGRRLKPTLLRPAYRNDGNFMRFSGFAANLAFPAGFAPPFAPTLP